MSQEWQLSSVEPSKRARGSSGPQGVPQGGKYLGRLVIEAWTADERGADGLNVEIELAEGSRDMAAVHRFAKEVANKLQRRLQHVPEAGP